jgi:excinuclease ABC subunit A
LGSALVGSLYILDEPSIGLHPRDTQALIGVLRRLQEMGNTVLVVEHDPDIMRAADYLVDIGPEAGTQGGEIVYEGAMRNGKPSGTKAAATRSHTIRYLQGEETIPTPTTRRAWNRYIEVVGARENNLKGITVRFPLNVMTCVTGVSGSGKSTLVRDIFYRALKRQYSETSLLPGEHMEIRGDISAAQGIELIDQNPIGKSSRSNPVTYLKAYDEIRNLMAAQSHAKQMHYTPAHFSFNTDGGRCEECKGEGSITIQMQFMADLTLPCEACGGTRFKKEIREVKFHGHDISRILNMTVEEALAFFAKHGEKRIVARLQPLFDVGLGYVQLGQSSSTLSGGESQRVKLAYYLAQGQEHFVPTIFVFDEPTTGLHASDIHRLLHAFNALIERGHTIVVIEHNLDMIKCADHLIDLGPEGGEDGGHIVFQGTPEELRSCTTSHTARYLFP